MTEQEIRDTVWQRLRETFKNVNGYFPNDEQLQKFFHEEVKPVVIKMMEEQDGLK
jgi:hypothetical protein